MLRKILLILLLMTEVYAVSDSCDNCQIRDLPISGLEQYTTSSHCLRSIDGVPFLEAYKNSGDGKKRRKRLAQASSYSICEILCPPNTQLVKYSTGSSDIVFLTSASYNVTASTWTGKLNASTVVPLTPPFLLGCFGPIRCGQFINENGDALPNRCNDADTSAICNEDSKLSMCSCSSGYSGPTCGYRTDYLERIRNWPCIVYADYLLNTIKTAQVYPSAFGDILPFIYSCFSKEQLMEKSWNLEEMIDSLDYELKEVNLRTAFTKSFDVVRGNCFTFNYANKTNTTEGLYNTRFAGKTRDFSIMLKLNPTEQIAWIDREALSVYIHAPGTPPVQGALYSLKASAADVIKLQKTITKLVARCISSIHELKQNYYEIGDYTREGCYSACYQDKVLEACGCMDPRYEKAETASYCVIRHFECIKDVLREFGKATSWPSCNCPVPCYLEEYTMIAAKSTLAFKARECGNETRCSDQTQTEARLKISLNSLEAHVYVEMPKITFSALLAQFGSQIGLIGISIVGLIEVILLCYQLGKGGKES